MRLERLAVVWLITSAVAGWALPTVACAQVLGPAQGVSPDATAAPEGPYAVSTRDLIKRLNRGRQLLAEQNYSAGIRLLQSIVESDEDAFYFPDPENKTKERSLKLESQTLLGGLPDEGREVYDKQYGPTARRLFDEAVRLHDNDGLALVARQYFHTPWGYEASYRLAADHLDHDRAQTAALSFERLRGAAPAARRFEPYLSIKTALSWMQAGHPDRAVQVLVELKAERGHKTLTLGGREIALFESPPQAMAWLTALAGKHQAGITATVDQWLMVGGDPGRNAPSAGGSPYLNRGWRSVTVEGATPSPDSDAVVANTFRERHPALPASPDDSSTSPSLPGVLPLLVDDRVIVRSIGDIRAYELATGRLFWATGEKDQLLTELMRSPAGPQAQVPGGGPLATLLTNRTWQDSTFGSLSSDGEFVFAVEDLGMGLAGLMVLRAPTFRDYNRLVAYDVKTGRAMWEAGGPRSNTDDGLGGTYFLGAPLVLDRRLYCLAETGSEVRLLVLDPRTGRLDWSQTLNMSSPAGAGFMTRQQSGLSPSFFGEILVCPVGSDQVVGVDLTRRSLAWRHKFLTDADLWDPRKMQVVQLQQQRQLLQQGGATVDQNRWLDSLAVVGEMRVIITPRDSNELFCLNLLDGSVEWKKPRGEGLFVAGIHQGKVLVIGRSYVQALNVVDGEPAWPEPASLPIPSGRGYVAGDCLHLPLVTAEVATISLRDGRILARARSLLGNVPGNLISIRGTVVSQGADFVETFRQLDALETEIAEALARNPDDAQALALRGEIRLQHGKVAEAYADLKRALELKSDDVGIRSLLVGSLLEGLRVDFSSYRGLVTDIEPLLTEPEERSAYLWLTAQGLKRAGDSRAALAALLRFGEPDVADRELERLDGMLVVRRDRLVRARAVELYASASSESRLEMDRDCRERAGRVRDKKDPGAVRRFLQYFGELADPRPLQRLAVELPSPDGDWLADEFQLEPLCAAKDADAAATATARMAQLLLAAERPADALFFIRRLERLWPQSVCLDGKTGSELAEEWLKKSAIARELALNAPWPTGIVEIEPHGPLAGNLPPRGSFEIPIAGESGTPARDMVLHVSATGKEFFARDGLGRLLWKVSVDQPAQQQMPMQVRFNRAYLCGHFVLFSIWGQVVAIDTLGTADQPGARLLWKVNLFSGSRPNIPPRGFAGNPRRRVMPNQIGEQVGTIGPVTREHVILLNGHKLMALEPLTGKPLWMREGVTPGTELFGDENLLYAIPPEGGPAMVYNALDGTIRGNRALPPERSRLDFVGRHVVTFQSVDSRQVLALHDPWVGKDRWSRAFEDFSQVGLIEFDEAAVLEPSGKLTVVSLADGSVRFEAAAEPEPQLQQIHVIRSRDHYVLIANTVSGNAIPGVAWGNISNQVVAVRGRVYGFDRGTAKRLWVQEFDKHGIDLQQPNNLPILTFMASFSQQRQAPLEYRLTLLDKRTGRLVFDKTNFEVPLLYVEYDADIIQKQLELRLLKSALRLTFTDKPIPAGEEAEKNKE